MAGGSTTLAGPSSFFRLLVELGPPDMLPALKALIQQDLPNPGQQPWALRVRTRPLAFCDIACRAGPWGSRSERSPPTSGQDFSTPTSTPAWIPVRREAPHVGALWRTTEMSSAHPVAQLTPSDLCESVEFVPEMIRVDLLLEEIPLRYSVNR